MIAAIIAFVTSIGGIGSILATLGGVSAALPFVGFLTRFKKPLLILGAVLAIAGLTLFAVAWHAGKVRERVEQERAEATAIERAAWQQKYNSALVDMTERLRQAQIGLAAKERSLIETEERLDAERLENETALRGALDGDAGGVIVPERVLRAFRSAAGQNAGHPN